MREHLQRLVQFCGRWTVFAALLLTMMVAGVLFLARDFIEHRIGWQWDDWGGWEEVFGLD